VALYPKQQEINLVFYPSIHILYEIKPPLLHEDLIFGFHLHHGLILCHYRGHGFVITGAEVTFLLIQPLNALGEGLPDPSSFDILVELHAFAFSRHAIYYVE
jgi:hypothetical protein